MARTLTQELDGLLHGATESGSVPGAVAIVAGEDGVLYAGAAGKRVLGGEDAFTPDTIAFYASMSKAITASAAMQLVEQGQLALDEPAAKICPELDEIPVLDGFDGNGKPKLRPARGRMTLRQMLTHTCGSTYEFCDADMFRYMEASGTPGILSATRATLRRALLVDPGTRWDYGLGIDWAGQMVERVSGMRLGDYLRKNLFEPLGMNESAFAVSAAGREKQAGVHARQPDGSLAPIPFELPAEPECDMGGHGLFGPMTDYVRFLQMILNGGTLGGTRVLEAKTVDLMSESYTEHPMRPIRTAMPEFTNDVELVPGVDWHYAISFAKNLQEIPGMRSAGSLSWAGITNSYYWIDRRKKVTGVVLTQILPFFDTKVLELSAGVETAVYRAL